MPETVGAHTREMANATLTDAGRNGLIKGAQGIALTALALLKEPTLLEEVKAEQAQTLASL